MIDQSLREAKQKMGRIIEALTEQLTTLRVGRASSGMVDNIQAELYGSKLPLKQMASITVPEANQIVLTPWDKSAIQAIETAIRQSDLGVNPINDGKAIRIILPPLTEERRKEFIRVVGRMTEEARIALRGERHTAWEAIQAAAKSGTITEDDRDRGRAELDKLIEEMNGLIEKIAKEKESELLKL